MQLLRVTTEVPPSFFLGEVSSTSAGGALEAFAAAATSTASESGIALPPNSTDAAALIQWSDNELLHPARHAHQSSTSGTPLTASLSPDDSEHGATRGRHGPAGDGADDWIPLSKREASSHFAPQQHDYSRSVWLTDLDELDLPSHDNSYSRHGSSSNHAHSARSEGPVDMLDMFSPAEDDGDRTSPPRRRHEGDDLHFSDQHAAVPQFTDSGFAYASSEQRDRHADAAHRDSMGSLLLSLGSSGAGGGTGSTWLPQPPLQAASRSGGGRWQAASTSLSDIAASSSRSAGWSDGPRSLGAASHGASDRGAAASHGIGVSSGWLGRDAEQLPTTAAPLSPPGAGADGQDGLDGQSDAAASLFPPLEMLDSSSGGGHRLEAALASPSSRNVARIGEQHSHKPAGAAPVPPPIAAAPAPVRRGLVDYDDDDDSADDIPEPLGGPMSAGVAVETSPSHVPVSASAGASLPAASADVSEPSLSGAKRRREEDNEAEASARTSSS
jgi:hypothetical protein